MLPPAYRRIAGRARAYLELARIELAGFSFVAVMGALSAGGTALSIPDAAVLFFCNILLVAFGFVHNDYADLQVDRASQRKERPLVRGSVSPMEALTISWVTFLINPLVAHLWFRNPWATGALLISELLAALYNLTSKRAVGADAFYAASAGALCLFGVLARGGPGAIPLIVVGLMFLEHLFFNIASGQLKDLRLDHAAGVRTLAVISSREINGALKVGPLFRATAFTVKAATIVLVFAPFMLGKLPANPFQVALLLCMALGALVLTVKLLYTDTDQRLRILNTTRMQETLSKAMIPIMLLPLIGIAWLLVLTVTPVLWFGFFHYLLDREILSNPKTF